MKNIKIIGKLKYIRDENFFSKIYNTRIYGDLKNNRVYNCIGIEDGMLRMIDESREDYLYNPRAPINPFYSELKGKWEILEDNEK